MLSSRMFLILGHKGVAKPKPKGGLVGDTEAGLKLLYF